jgi:putative sigma-54 modulation protein
MQVRCHAHQDIRAGLRAAAITRVHRALRRLRWLVPQVVVDLGDVNGARGGVDKQCRVRLLSPGLEPVIVTAYATRWGHALDRALSRAVRSLLERRRRAAFGPALVRGSTG